MDPSRPVLHDIVIGEFDWKWYECLGNSPPTFMYWKWFWFFFVFSLSNSSLKLYISQSNKYVYITTRYYSIFAIYLTNKLRDGLKGGDLSVVGMTTCKQQDGQIEVRIGSKMMPPKSRVPSLSPPDSRIRQHKLLAPHPNPFPAASTVGFWLCALTWPHHLLCSHVAVS